MAACANKTAFVLGYTGEVGKEIVRELLEKKIFKKVVLIGRRSVTYEDPLYASVEQRVVDFDNLENHKDAFQGCEYLFSCLGTTRAAAGAAGFVKIEHDYVVNAAKLAHEMGCKRYSIVSATNADKNGFFLYSKTKGQADAEVSEIPFEKVTVARPGFLLSDRNANRVGERVATVVLKPLIWAKPTLLSVPTTKVAKAIIFNTCTDPIEQRVDIVYNAKLHEISDNNYDKYFAASASAN
jgi:oxidoreductase